jgi:hypothetical protein
MKSDFHPELRLAQGRSKPSLIPPDVLNLLGRVSFAAKSAAVIDEEAGAFSSKIHKGSRTTQARIIGAPMKNGIG